MVTPIYRRRCRFECLVATPARDAAPAGAAPAGATPAGAPAFMV